jgi:hypothetical protein
MQIEKPIAQAKSELSHPTRLALISPKQAQNGCRRVSSCLYLDEFIEHWLSHSFLK